MMPVLSLQSRLMLTVSICQLVALVLSGWLLLQNARAAVTSELESTSSFIEQVLGGAASERVVRSGSSLRRLLQTLSQVRHIDVTVQYRDGGSDSNIGSSDESTETVPDWFTDMIQPASLPAYEVQVTGPGPISRLVVRPDPIDELSEIWEDIQPLLAVAPASFVIILLLIYVGLRFGLRPLADLSAGFERLESGDFNVELRAPAVSELRIINGKFNRMVGVLRATAEDNALLTRGMVQLQEEERRSITRELHDDIAPLLFSIRVATAQAGSDLSSGATESVRGQLGRVDEAVVQLQKDVRNLLTRLRPMVLDDLSLKEALEGLVADWRRREPAISWSLELSGLVEPLTDSISVTTYRIVQECLTNAARHAGATTVTVSVSRFAAQGSDGGAADDYDELFIVIADDGRGFDDDHAPGFGLIGMRERVRALQGRLSLQNQAQGGAKIEVRIPLTVSS